MKHDVKGTVLTIVANLDLVVTGSGEIDGYKGGEPD